MTNEQKFFVKAPAERVWAFLTDPHQVAQCLPGAAITEKVDDRTYRGTITVKVGPVAASYKGRISFDRLDVEKLEADLSATGQDTKGKGGAEMQMRSRLVRGDGGTEVHVTTDVKISGILAQMGRGLIESVSNQMFQRFAGCVQQKLAGEAEAPDPAAASIDAVSLAGDAVKGAVKKLLGRE